MKQGFKKIKLVLTTLLVALIIYHNINASYLNMHNVKTYSTKESDYITSCYMNLSITNSNSLSISSTVTTLGTVDKITIDIELQMRIGDKWVLMDNWNVESFNTFTLSIDKTFSNAPSGEYRFYEIYSAKVGNKKETKTAYSNTTILY